MLSIIVAMTDERVIGRNNALPWHLSEDLKRFKKITMGSPIVMGRKTFGSIGKALPGRRNIVITRNSAFKAEGAEVVHSLDEALYLCERLEGDKKDFFVIGGAEVFRLALPKAGRLYLTLIHKKFEGDVYFPEFDLKKDFKVIEKSDHASPGDPPFSYSFITAERK